MVIFHIAMFNFQRVFLYCWYPEFVSIESNGYQYPKLVGGWAYPSEKYECVNWDDYSQYMEKEKSCSKPSTSKCVFFLKWSHLGVNIPHFQAHPKSCWPCLYMDQQARLGWQFRKFRHMDSFMALKMEIPHFHGILIAEILMFFNWSTLMHLWGRSLSSNKPIYTSRRHWNCDSARSFKIQGWW